MSNRRPISNAPGQYDFPPAQSTDTSVPAYDFDAIPPRLQSLRPRLSDERFRAAFDFDPPYPPHRAAPPMSRSPGDSDSQNRMRSVLRAINENEGTPPSELALPPASPGSGSMAPPARRRARPSERFQRLNDQRARRQQASVDTWDSTFSEASDRLAQSNDQLRSLLDRPLRSNSRSRTSRFTETDEDMIHTSESQHRRKRRRTEGPTREHPLPPLHPVNYGWHGQARSGPLQMEVRFVDSDGAPFDYEMIDRWDAPPLGRIQNVLRDDSTEYCSRQRYANIVLQHPDERLLTLNRLVIKTPDTIEDDSILEGLVFTSRTIDATFDRTARYQIHTNSGQRFGARSRRGQGGLRNYLRSTGRAEDALRHLPPLHPSDEVHHHQQVSADCEADSLASDSDDVVDAFPPRSVMREQQASPSQSESNSDSDSSGLVFPDISPPTDSLEWTSSRLRQGLWREGGLDVSEGDDALAEDVSNNPEDAGAQSDFDEVLRRGAVISAERRRRRIAIRERVHRTVMQRRAAAQAARAGDAPTPHSESANPLPRTRQTGMFNPRLLEPMEPPARPEDSRWNDSPSELHMNPWPTVPDDESDSADDTSKPLTDNNLMEANAFFSTHRQARLRFTTDASTRQANDLPVSQNAVSVVYKVKKYGGRITIDFQAPVSTRFILLKLWKSQRAGTYRERGNGRAGNVILSRVRVEGFCGPRSFPAVEIA